MGIEAIQNKDMLAYKSECYVGMTAEEAKEAGRSIFREFEKINTDGNNELSIEEIVAHRDKVATKKRRWGNTFLAIGAYYCYNGLKLESMSKEVAEYGAEIASKILNTKVTAASAKKNNLIYALTLVGIGVAKCIKSKKIDEKTFEYNVDYHKQMASS